MRIWCTAAAVLLVTACGGVEPTETPSTDGTSSALALPPQAAEPAVVHASVPVCPGPAALGSARCHSHVLVGADGAPSAATAPAGYGPADLRSAYGLVGSGDSSQTIAIVDAYDNPNAERDLATYRSQFGLPPCTTANGCFKKVNQSGGTKLPRADQGWALEIALDLQAASAICPGCKLLLVEASTNSFSNLMTAVDTAVRLGATVVSNSYGASEFSGETSYESHFDHPGIAITVSSGDSGYGVEYPAASQYVTAVGGTTLRTSGSGGWSQTAWSGAGSGCSAYVAKPGWQKDAGCSRRAVADVSAVADPNTGLAVYDSYGYQGRRGWFVVGGTSASAPIVAAVYALAGNAGATLYGSYPYAHATSLLDVVSGANGSCGATAYLCTAGDGYDGPTGLGTPNGTSGF